MLGQPLSVSERQDRDGGFTLIELLVVIIVLGILAGVVVFAVNGVGDKGRSAAINSDAKVVRTAEETYLAKNGTYGTEDQLVAAGLLDSPSSYTDVALTAGGPTGTSFLLGYGVPNGGTGSSLASVTLPAATGNGWPTPFAWQKGGGIANAHFLFDPLLWKDETGNPVPWLATAWTQSADGLTWTFTIRNGVKWSDGQPFTADDVAFTYAYEMTGAGNTTQGSKLQLINSVTSDLPTNTVTFHMISPQNTFMQTIAESVVIIPQHIWATIGDPKLFGTPTQSAADPSGTLAYVGTGAYTLNNPLGYNPATGVAEYDANPNFFLGIPFVRKLLYITSTNPVTDLLNGTLSASPPSPSQEKVTAADLQPLAGLPSVKNPGGFTRSIQFNFWAGFPYNNVAFRQALAYAINKPDLISRMLSGNAEVPSTGIMSPESPWMATGLPGYNFSLAKANSLLDSIGMTAPSACGGVAGPGCLRTLPGGSPFTAQIRSTFALNNVDLDPILTSYLAAVGININITIDSQATGDTNANKGNYSMMIEGWGNLAADPDQLRTAMSDTYTGALTAACTPGATFHDGCYSHGTFNSVFGWNSSLDNAACAGCPSFSALTDHSADFVAKSVDQQTTTVPGQRLADIQAMESDIAADLPMIELYVPTAILYYQPTSLTAWYFTPGGTPPGPSSFFNKEVFVTGKQFGLPAGF